MSVFPLDFNLDYLKTISFKDHESFELNSIFKVRLENGWNSKQMITEGEAAIPRAPSVIKRNQNKDQL